jgi:NAD(P)-dependent dehydrogenase (short-subunit alcohol dehydrogenase family)
VSRISTYEDKVVFVSGGTDGINLGIAKAFASEGARVCVMSRRQERVDAAVAALLELGGEAIGFAADVRDPTAVSAALAATVSAWGPIDVVVSGAAGNFLALASELSTAGFKTVVDIDLLGTFNVMRGAWPHLRKPGAAILSMSAPQSWLPMPLQVHVCAAKAGVDQVTRTLAIEWGGDGVRVNSIAPGPIGGTEGMKRLAATASAVETWVQNVPLKRFGTLDDIANAALWLCSDAASYVTGVVLAVDGGISLGGSSAIARGMRP